MSTGVPLAQSYKAQVAEFLLGFLPEWLQVTVLVLIVAAVLVSWGFKLRRRIARARAGQTAPPARAEAVPQSRGADFLGPYAPTRQPPDRLV
ncbi:hypothetical protein ACWC10_29280 [Streptomyces sp. NPDC001595]|uniref:hypothetical protein n=1 Tax=Streptomyces sp. NPDC001532 TaxID=3154520 RepID=UPI00331934E3